MSFDFGMLPNHCDVPGFPSVATLGIRCLALPQKSNCKWSDLASNNPWKYKKNEKLSVAFSHVVFSVHFGTPSSCWTFQLSRPFPTDHLLLEHGGRWLCCAIILPAFWLLLCRDKKRTSCSVETGRHLKTRKTKGNGLERSGIFWQLVIAAVSLIPRSSWLEQWRFSGQRHQDRSISYQYQTCHIWQVLMNCWVGTKLLWSKLWFSQFRCCKGRKFLYITRQGPLQSHQHRSPASCRLIVTEPFPNAYSLFTKTRFFMVFIYREEHSYCILNSFNFQPFHPLKPGWMEQRDAKRSLFVHMPSDCNDRYVRSASALLTAAVGVANPDPVTNTQFTNQPTTSQKASQPANSKQTLTNKLALSRSIKYSIYYWWYTRMTCFNPGGSGYWLPLDWPKLGGLALSVLAAPASFGPDLQVLLS